MQPYHIGTEEKYSPLDQNIETINYNPWVPRNDGLLQMIKYLYTLRKKGTPKKHVSYIINMDSSHASKLITYFNFTVDQYLSRVHSFN